MIRRKRLIFGRNADIQPLQRISRRSKQFAGICSVPRQRNLTAFRYQNKRNLFQYLDSHTGGERHILRRDDDRIGRNPNRRLPKRFTDGCRIGIELLPLFSQIRNQFKGISANHFQIDCLQRTQIKIRLYLGSVPSYLIPRIKGNLSVRQDIPGQVFKS